MTFDSSFFCRCRKRKDQNDQLLKSMVDFSKQIYEQFLTKSVVDIDFNNAGLAGSFMVEYIASTNSGKPREIMSLSNAGNVVAKDILVLAIDIAASFKNTSVTTPTQHGP